MGRAGSKIYNETTMNVTIVGAGPAGEAAARAIRTQNKEAEIILIEKEEAGGLCLNKGCIPSKALLEQVHKRAQTESKINWEKLQTFKTQVVTEIRTALEQNLKRMNVSLIKGKASFGSPHSIEVNNGKNSETLTFDKAILTAGTENVYPPPFDQHIDSIFDSDRILTLKKVPQSLVVVGGGAVGLEFACMMNALGTKVTIVEMQPGILPGEDPAVISALTRIYEGRGIKIIPNAKVTGMKKDSDWKLKLSNNETITSEQILVSVGRKPNLKSFSLEKANIKTNKDHLVLNESLQTSNPNIYAAGDVTGLTRLAHAAAAMGEVAGQNALGAKNKFDESLVPRCLYSWPEVASVGKWKYELEENNEPVKATRAFFKGSSKALAAGETDGFVQVVSEPETGKILGAQILGSHATELIHVFCVALQQKMTTKDLGNVMFAHPTLSETIRDACLK